MAGLNQNRKVKPDHLDELSYDDGEDDQMETEDFDQEENNGSRDGKNRPDTPINDGRQGEETRTDSPQADPKGGDNRTDSEDSQRGEPRTNQDDPKSGELPANSQQNDSRTEEPRANSPLDDSQGVELRADSKNQDLPSEEPRTNSPQDEPKGGDLQCDSQSEEQRTDSPVKDGSDPLNVIIPPVPITPPSPSTEEVSSSPDNTTASTSRGPDSFDPEEFRIPAAPVSGTFSPVPGPSSRISPVLAVSSSDSGSRNEESSSASSSSGSLFALVVGGLFYLLVWLLVWCAKQIGYEAALRPRRKEDKPNGENPDDDEQMAEAKFF